jgi:hypothetical protein
MSLWMWWVGCEGEPPGPSDEPPAGTTPTPTSPTSPTTPTTPTSPTTPTTADAVTDTFPVTPVPTDVLFVVDNSGSMVDDQYRAADQLAGVVTELVTAGVDFHLGVTTTDLDGRYDGAGGTLVSAGGQTFLDAATPNPEEAFAWLMVRGNAGSSTEQGVGATYWALEPSVGRADPLFRRDDAAIHVVVISDEPDLTRQTLVSDAEFDAWFDALAEDDARRTFSAFSHPTYGDRYGALATRFGGVLQSAVVDDWSAGAAGLVDRFLLGEPAFTLSGDPDATSIVVTVRSGGADTELLPEEWAFDPSTRTVEVLVHLAPGDEVVVTYAPAP